MKPFTTEFTFKFRQTDMAGIGYFNEVFNLFHDGYEDWAQLVCGSKDIWFNNGEWAVPLIKIESEYLAPLFAFKTYQLTISLKSVGSSSFVLNSDISHLDHHCCRIVSAHVFMSKTTRKSMPIPPSILSVLNPQTQT